MRTYTEAVVSKSIVYNVVNTEEGWRIEASVPPRTPSRDRLMVLQWLDSYKSEIKGSNPSWLVMFRATDRMYTLDIIPMPSQQNATKPDQVESVWKQLSLEYA